LTFVGKTDRLSLQKGRRMKKSKLKVITGRPPMLEHIMRVKELRDKKQLSFRDIAKLLESDVKTVYRWYHYPVGNIRK
jgi:DNA-binding transcriptional regulator YiaG